MAHLHTRPIPGLPGKGDNKRHFVTLSGSQRHPQALVKQNHQLQFTRLGQKLRSVATERQINEVNEENESLSMIIKVGMACADNLVKTVASPHQWEQKSQEHKCNLSI